MKYKTLSAVLIALIVALTGCNEDPTYYKLDDQPDHMHLKVSEADITLSKALENDVAVTFTWEAAQSPIANYDSITYAFRLYNTEDKNGSSTEFMKIGRETTKSFTTDELNSIIGKWIAPGEKINITAEVVGTVNNEKTYIKPEMSTITFDVTGYEKYPTNLYLHLDADDGSIITARLSQRTIGTGIYEGTIDMKPGAFFFTTTAGADYPAYGKAQDNTLSYVSEGEISKFDNTASGKRTIVVDTNSDYFDCNVYNVIVPPNGFLHIVGNGCSVGWDLSSIEADFVQTDARHPYLWSWTGQFNAGGEIKIALGNGWGDQFFFAPKNNADPMTNHELLPYRYQNNGGDVKWVPSVSGKYKFTLCLLSDDMWTSFEAVK